MIIFDFSLLFIGIVLIGIGTNSVAIAAGVGFLLLFLKD